MTPDSKDRRPSSGQISLSELETNKSIFFNITQSLNSSDQKGQKVFSFSSGKKGNGDVLDGPLTEEKTPSESTQDVVSISKKESSAKDSFTFNLIRKKMEEKTIEEPYKGAHLGNEKDANNKENLFGEVNKYLWLIFHDLHLKGSQSNGKIWNPKLKSFSWKIF